MNNQFIEQSLYKYFSGRSSSEEEDSILLWLKESKAHQAQYKEISEKWALRHLPDITDNKTKVHFRILNQLIARQEKRHSIGFTLSRIAAIFVLGAVLGFASLYLKKPLSPTYDEGLFSEITVPNGSCSQLRLPDGSTVWLNAGSQLTYQNDFGNKNRVVSLAGEALFEIKSDSLNPFRIKTGDMDAVVTGTVLMVKAYQNDPVVELTLMEGKTRVENTVNNKISVLRPNQRLVYEKASGKTSMQNVDAAKYAEWMNGKIFFADEPFEVLAKQLERLYDINIIIESEKLKKERFYGSFDKSSGILHIMKMINIDNQFKWTFANETLIISNKK